MAEKNNALYRIVLGCALFKGCFYSTFFVFPACVAMRRTPGKGCVIFLIKKDCMKEIYSQNFSLIVPNGCPAKCDFCVTDTLDSRINFNPLNHKKLERSVKFSKELGANCCSISGGGEPTLLLGEGQYVSEALKILKIG